VTLPARWADLGLSGFTGRVRFRRRFGYPGRLDDYERVWLTCAGAGSPAEVSLNGTALGARADARAPFEFEVTALLRGRNELVVDVAGGAEDGGLWGEVALEVRCTAFLRGVRLWAAPAGGCFDLHAAGEVVGTAERPLDLYVVLDRSTAAYAAVTAAPEGRPFHLVAAKLGKEGGPAGTGGPARTAVVKVDLVNGASVWYTVEQELGFDSARAGGG
jgi:hypothetical protein